MALFEAWKRIAHDVQGNPIKRVWDDYQGKEKRVYKDIISKKMQKIEGTIDSISQEFGLSHVHTAVFMDGIHAAVDGLPPTAELETDTAIKFEIDFKRLYKQMVQYKAKELYTLKEWDGIFTPDEQQALYKEQKESNVMVRSKKTGRNEACPCGSGKKYKKCCVS